MVKKSKDIADALARSNAYARAEHIKKDILIIKCNYGFFGIKNKRILWCLCIEIIRPLQCC